MAKSYEKKGDYYKAIEIYKRVLSKYSQFIPEQENIGIATLPFIFYKIGECLMAIGKYQEAIKEYNNVVKRDIYEYWKFFAHFKKFFIYKFKLGDEKFAMKEWINFSQNNKLSVFSSILQDSLGDLAP